MFKLFKKNNENAAATELTPEQITAALDKEAKRLRRKETAKKILRNTINGAISAGVGILVYRIMEDRFGGSSDADTTTVPATNDVSCDDYITADAAMDYTTLEEV